MVRDLTRGPIVRGFLLFALPMMAGNLLQQCYNIADTLIVGRALGADALAAVGASYTLMTFLTSIFLGLSMGAGTLFSIYRGGGREDDLRSGIFQGLLLILGVTLALNVGVYAFLRPILSFLRVPEELRGDMAEYLRIIFAGLMASALYNYLACLLRALGNSVAPLVFLLLATVGNVDWIWPSCWGWAGALPGRPGLPLRPRDFPPRGFPSIFSPNAGLCSPGGRIDGSTDEFSRKFCSFPGSPVCSNR